MVDTLNVRGEKDQLHVRVSLFTEPFRKWKVETCNSLHKQEIFLPILTINSFRLRQYYYMAQFTKSSIALHLLHVKLCGYIMILVTDIL